MSALGGLTTLTSLVLISIRAYVTQPKPGFRIGTCLCIWPTFMYSPIISKQALYAGIWSGDKTKTLPNVETSWFHTLMCKTVHVYFVFNNLDRIKINRKVGYICIFLILFLMLVHVSKINDSIHK